MENPFILEVGTAASNDANETINLMTPPVYMEPRVSADDEQGRERVRVDAKR